MADLDSRYQRPRRQARTDEVYRAIKELLMMREIAPGSPIRSAAIAERLSVSPTPVREALAALEIEGLVSRTPMVGYAAARELDRAAFEGLFEVRLLLEPVAARDAALNTNASSVQRIHDALERMRNAEARRWTASEARQFIEQDSRFHNEVAAMSGNPWMADAVRRLHSQVHLFRVMASPDAIEHVVPEHASILAAIRQGDAATASSAMAAHILAARERSAPFVTSQ